MPVFPFPKKSLQLDYMFLRFWWSFPQDKFKGFAPNSRDNICLSKAFEGQGIRKMGDINLASVAELGGKS